MTAIYAAGNIPFVFGDAVGGKYLFRAIRFLWHHKVAMNSSIEHTLNGRTLAMEMQLLAENQNENECMPNKFLIFSWFFVENKSKNYSLEPLLKCLKFIRRPNTMKTIRKPFRLDRIVYPSTGGFYGYMRCDTRTHQIHHQLIEANHLIPIGITQLSEFHKLAHHHIECSCSCSVNESVRIENHSSNAMKLVEYLNRTATRPRRNQLRTIDWYWFYAWPIFLINRSFQFKPLHRSKSTRIFYFPTWSKTIFATENFMQFRLFRKCCLIKHFYLHAYQWHNLCAQRIFR